MKFRGSWTFLFVVAALFIATLEQARASRNVWEIQRRQAREILFNGLQNPATKVDGLPPTDQPALVARFIVNQADWAAVATISAREDIVSAPFASLTDISDGTLGSGSGVPYMFLTPLSSVAINVAADPRASLMVSLAQGTYCEKKNYDPMDPRCARAILTGTIKKIEADDAEYSVAKAAVFGRHPWLVFMPPNHHFFFAKLELGTIAVLDYFGGAKMVTPEQYLNA